MSAESSNLLPKMDSKEHKAVLDFVKAKSTSAKFNFDGERGSGKVRLCAQPNDPTKQPECVDLALEAKELFSTMQRLNFFCALPSDDMSKTYIECERIPQ